MNDYNDYKNSIFLITGNFDNKNFGTGFVFHKDNKGTYLLTCRHVVNLIQKNDDIKINFHTPVNEIIVSNEPEYDIAILITKDIITPDYNKILKLGIAEKKECSIIIYGNYLFDTVNTVFRVMPVKGTLSMEGWFNVKCKTDKITTWNLKIDDMHCLQRGYSGSPVIENDTGVVIGIVSHMIKDNTGVAISVESLNNIWKEIPKNLLKRLSTDNISSKKLDTVQVKERVKESKEVLHIEILDPVCAFEYSLSEVRWKALYTDKNPYIFSYDSYKKISNKLNLPSIINNRSYIIGLPKIGKTTLCKNLLASSSEVGYVSYYLPYNNQKNNNQ